jgi:hypothetical protein
MLIRRELAAVFDEITRLRHQVKGHLLLGALDGLQVIVIVVSLADDTLLGIAFDQVVRAVGDLLVLESKLLIFTVVGVHLTKALLQSLDSSRVNCVTISDLVLCRLLAVSRMVHRSVST